MLFKHPKPAIRKWIKKGAFTLFIVEGICFVGTYFIWHRINTDRDTRKYLFDHYPSVLESYYKIGETIDSQNKIRHIDLAYWDKKT